MLEKILQIVEIPGDRSRGISEHFVQALDILNDRDISRVIFYGGPNEEHDVLVGDSAYEHPPTICLKNYRGNKPDIQLPHKVIRLYDDYQLRDLSERSNGKFPYEKLILVRNFVRLLEQEKQISRISPKCSQCMRLDFQIAEPQRG